MKKNYTLFKMNYVRSLIVMSVFMIGLVSSSYASVYDPDTIIAINCGGDEYVAIDGTVFHKDTLKVKGGGYTAANAIEGTEDDVIYQSETNGNFIYSIPVPTHGKYKITLKFAETFFGKTGKRLFNLHINDEEALSNFDVNAAAGGKNIATDTAFSLIVTDSVINIVGETLLDNAKISAFVVERVYEINYTDVIAINCGGDDYTATDGTFFYKDTLSSGGATYSGNNSIDGTEDDVLYQSERWGNYTYNIPVSDGTYSVTLMIAEIYFGNPGNRIWDVLLEDEKVLENFDATAVAGKNVAIDTTFTVKVTDGEINIETQKIKDNGKLSAIKVVKVLSQPLMAINCGGKEYANAEGIVFLADTLSTGGVYNEGAAAGKEIEGTDDDVLYQSERWGGDFSYNIPLDNGKYDVTLMFAETFFGNPGNRIFNASIEGTEVLSEFDITGLVGKLTALDTTFTASVYDGELNIGFTKIKDNGKISAILISDNVSSEIFWIEDFALADSTILDDGETAWEAVRENGFFGVKDSTLVVNEGGDEGVFTSQVIDISSGPAKANLYLRPSAELESDQDYVQLYAVIDEGEEVLLDEIWGGVEGDTIELNAFGLKGSTLQLIIKTFVSFENEFYYIDSLTVKSISDDDIVELTAESAHGELTIDPDGGSYIKGTEVTLSVTADYGYNFLGWGEDLADSTSNPITVVMDSSINITALFEELPTYTLTTHVTNGSVFVLPEREVYAENEEVTLVAQPLPGFELIEWTDGTTTISTEKEIVITMDANKDITAVINEIPAYSLTVTADANGSVQILPDKETYDPGAAVVIKANANDGYRFSAWTGDYTGTDNPISIIMNADKTITATFELIPASYTLTVAATNGSVTMDPEGGTYEDGTVVTLTAVADEGYEFSEWTGDMTGTDNPATVTMSADKSVTAAFTVITGINSDVNPSKSALMQNFPNPFTSETTIPYQLNEASDVNLSIYNFLGQKVKTLVNDHQSAGYYSIDWTGRDENGKQLSNGLYIFRLEVGNNAVQVKRSVLMK